jgi:hypothetical protein
MSQEIITALLIFLLIIIVVSIFIKIVFKRSLKEIVDDWIMQIF